MAQPLNSSDTSYSPIIFSDPISFPGRTKKRAHDYGDDGIEDDSQKTRRVNPQRLAARLGPEIVAEMEALIYPGAKMPSFEVRRVIQERYAVDRRHIYDYFHSRGLRVAKEDRHLNLTRGRLSKALARQTAEKPPPVISSDTKCSMDKTDSQLGDNQQLKDSEGDSSIAEIQATPSQATKSPVSNPIQIFENAEYLSTRNAKLVATERINGNNHGRFRTMATEGVSHLVKDRPLSKRRKMVLAKSKSLIETPCSRTPSPCLTPLEIAWDDDSSLSGYCGSPESFLALCDVPVSPNTELPLNYHQPKTPAVIEEHRALTEMERHELYNFINDSIGITSGIMEQAGTYTAYMKERTQKYFDRISSSGDSVIFHEARGGLFSDPKDEEIDLRNWFSDYIHDPEENYRADSLHYEEFKPFENKAIPNVLPQHGSTIHIQRSGYTILPSHLINAQLSSMEDRTRSEPLHSDCATISAIVSQSASPDELADHAQTLHYALPRQRRHTTRLRMAPLVQKTTSNLEILHNTSNLMISGPTEVSNSLLDHNNRLYLHISRPRLRTSSAGGGL